MNRIIEFPVKTLEQWKRLAVAIDAANPTDSYPDVIHALILRLSLHASLRQKETGRRAS